MLIFTSFHIILTRPFTFGRRLSTLRSGFRALPGPKPVKLIENSDIIPEELPGQG